jgi:hypothetical protein
MHNLQGANENHAERRFVAYIGQAPFCVRLTILQAVLEVYVCSDTLPRCAQLFSLFHTRSPQALAAQSTSPAVEYRKAMCAMYSVKQVLIRVKQRKEE